MTDVDPALIDQLAHLRGLGEAFYDHGGTLRYFSRAARTAILNAMGVDTGDAARVRAAIDAARQSIASGEPNAALCFQPAILNRKKCWGLSVQLYSLRSTSNWGIGDFSDLRELIELAAPLGCDVIGLNPLHALFVADPEACSPYSPSSRLFLNILYIAVEALEEFKQSAAAQALVGGAEFQAALSALRKTDNVMYEQVAALKLSVLRLLYEEFSAGAELGSERRRAFAEFRARRGEALERHAIFEALDARFRENGTIGWRTWPPEYRKPDTREVLEFAKERAHDVEFFVFAQWLADRQLSELQKFARTNGLGIGLYGDLAVGASPDGSEIWSNPALYVADASVGAPPDPLALGGQDWGIPPIDPNALRAQNFEPFRALLRANMENVGAIRIDHVMALFRLWWVPRGFSAVEGVYVHYPLASLIDLLARESRESHCLVIGEDLGTVPDEMRNAMEAGRLYHYKVLLFEKRTGRFNAPGEYPRHSVATAATHDLPPLKAWWQGDDLELRERLGLYPKPDTASMLRSERASDRVALLRALNEAGLWFWQPHEKIPEFSLPLARAMQLYLGKAEAALVLVQLEDLIGMTDPVNVPGTHTEHANWRRKLEATTAEIFARTDVRESLSALSKARAGLDPNQ